MENKSKIRCSGNVGNFHYDFEGQSLVGSEKIENRGKVCSFKKDLEFRERFISKNLKIGFSVFKTLITRLKLLILFLKYWKHDVIGLNSAGLNNKV